MNQSLTNDELRNDPLRNPLSLKSLTSESIDREYSVCNLPRDSNSVTAKSLNKSVRKKKSSRSDAYMAHLKRRKPDWFQ